jgi:hypothetical protein
MSMTTIIMTMIAIVEPIRFSLAPVDGVGGLGWSGVCVGGGGGFCVSGRGLLLGWCFRPWWSARVGFSLYHY